MNPENNMKNDVTLRQLQDYVKKTCQENGWDKNTVEETFLLFTEEVGELAKAIRYAKGIFVSANAAPTPKKEDLEDEFADVLMYVLDLANQCGVDLQEAFAAKDNKNKNRSWISK